MLINDNIPAMPGGDDLGIMILPSVSGLLDAIDSTSSLTGHAYQQISSYISSIRWYPVLMNDITAEDEADPKKPGHPEIGIYHGIDADGPPKQDLNFYDKVIIGSTALNTLNNYIPLPGKTRRALHYKIKGANVDALLESEGCDNFLRFTEAQFSIYIPFCGFHSLNIADIFTEDSDGHFVDLDLYILIDLISGKGTAALFRNVGDGLATNLITVTEGKIGIDVTFGINNSSEMATNNLQTGIATAAGLATAAGTFAAGHPALAGLAIGTTLINGATRVLTNKPAITRGSVGDSLNAIQLPMTPQLIIDLPNVVTQPPEFWHEVGHAAGYMAKLSTLKGYTKISEIHLDNIIAPAEELDELEQLLKSGVIL